MKEIRTLTIDGQLISADASTTILEAAKEHDIHIPTLCHLEGLGEVGACRLCLVEIEGHNRLQPACVTRVEEGMTVRTASSRLRQYRRMILELLFSEGDHICSVCVANNACELQDLAYAAGMDHVRFDYLHAAHSLDASHDRFVVDHHRCILCTRCVRVCAEIEGAHTWDIAGRGHTAYLVSDLAHDWGNARSCTSCGKCLLVCPTGALFAKGFVVSDLQNKQDFLRYIANTKTRDAWKDE